MPRVLFVQHTNPAGYPPIEHAISILLQAGWEVKSVGARVAVTDALHMPERAGLTASLMRLPPANRMLQKLHFLCFCCWVAYIARRWRPDLLYVSNASAAPAAMLARSLLSTTAVYHEHDSPGAPQTVFQRATEWCRRALCKRAAVVVLPNAARARNVAEAMELPIDRVLTVFNCPMRSESSANSLTAPTSENDLPFWIYYHGSIVPERIPLVVIDALVLSSPRVCLRIVGYETPGSLGYLAEMRRYATARGVIGRVEFVGPVSRADIHQFAQLSHVGLSLMPMHSDDVNMTHMVGASNKPFDYLASGCPLIVSDLLDWREMFVDCGLAASCDPQSAASIAAAIAQWLTQPHAYRLAQAEGLRRVADTWNYETQFAPVMNVIQRTEKFRSTQCVQR